MRPDSLILTILLSAGFLLFVAPVSVLSSDENISPDSWVYPALRSFELAGCLELPPDMPWTRREVESFLDRILEYKRDDVRQLTPRLEFLLVRLKDEFYGKGDDPSEREDPPLWSIREGKRYLLFDLSARCAVRKRPERDRGEVDGLAIPSLLADLGRGVTFYCSYRLKMEPEWETNIAGIKPSARERSFRGLTSEYERAYLAVSGNRWRVLVGRDYLNWGSGRDEGLLISRSAGSFDQLSASVSLGRFTLSTIHVVLEPEMPRRLAGHRLRVNLPGGAWLGLSETVVYTGRDIDGAYLLPAGSYYANQYNESDDDNILIGLDWKIPVINGLILYGELLIDDFQYEDRQDAPDRIGLNIAAEGRFSRSGREIELMADYTYIDIFTYAHKDELVTRYVTGNGDQDLNLLIGSQLGPDSDRWRIKAKVPFHPRVVLSSGFDYIRRGEGNDLREWDRAEDPDPAFPSGDVANEKDLYLSALCDLGKGSFVNAGGGVRMVDIPGQDLENTGFAWFELLLDF
ncbi:MAG: hypothetical protein JW746_02295 [Candidatus Krumholzibacteriota bacterium]|nr:hypothetical protein [Candidatus Krumholzibacteriota bacterium]